MSQLLQINAERCGLFPGSLALLTQEARWEHYFNWKFTLQKDHSDTPPLPKKYTGTIRLFLTVAVLA